MSTFVFDAIGEPETERLGQTLAKLLPAGSVVALCGPLGAGKTRLVRALGEALGVAPGTVASPTFVLVHEYPGSRPIYHFDAYRVKDEDEFLALAPFEYFESAGLSFVEWGDRVRNCLPAEYLEIVIEPTGPQARKFTLISHGRSHESMLAELAELLGKRR